MVRPRAFEMGSSHFGEHGSPQRAGQRQGTAAAQVLTLKDEKQGQHFPWHFCGAMALASDHTSVARSWGDTDKAGPQRVPPLVTQAPSGQATGKQAAPSRPVHQPLAHTGFTQ